MPLNTSTSAEQLHPLTLARPERESLQFTVNLEGESDEFVQLVQHIKTVAEQFLYHWKTFPIELPQPLTPAALTLTNSGNNDSDLVGNPENRSINLENLFIAPLFDELEAVASDRAGNSRRLTDSQLQSLRENGEFNVESLNFPGQVHRWRLSQLLEKGTRRTNDSFSNDLALATELIVVTAHGRIFSHLFSVYDSIYGLCNGFIKIVDSIIGIPALWAHNLDYKIKQERRRFLVAELVCRPELENCFDGLCSHVRKMLPRLDFDSFEVSQPVPYLFLTPGGQEIDLRLLSSVVMRKALPILTDILEAETRGWFAHFTKRLIAELRAKKLTDREIEDEVNEAAMKEYLQRVYTSILANAKLAELGQGIPELLVQQAQSFGIMQKAVDKVEKYIKRSGEDYQKRLVNDHPILSRIKPWLSSKLRRAEESTLSKSSWSAHEEALEMCCKHNLHQTAYFLGRDLAFMKEREPVLLKELKNTKKPIRTFEWAYRIWFPKSWIVKRKTQEQWNVIPTVINQLPSIIETPRAVPVQRDFLVEKETIRTTSTRWPFWRLFNLVQRSWCWTWNTMFNLGIVIPWCSSVSLRALFRVKPFMPDLELSQIDGTLSPRQESITQTMASRLMKLWRSIPQSIQYFEARPDTGLLGKCFTRPINRVWNYFFKGFLGTLAILFAFPLLCLVCSLLSILLAVTAPLWIPILTILLHIYMILIYDLDSPGICRNRHCILVEALIWDILIRGCIQPIAGVIVACILCPLGSAVILIVGVIRYFLRLVWDFLTFHLIIKKIGRIPSSDSLAAKRIAGPGLAKDYHFIIRPEQALAAFEAKVELDELQAYQQAMERIISRPQNDFSKFVKTCFAPFAAQLSNTEPYLSLDQESRKLMATLEKKLSERRGELRTDLGNTMKRRIKLNNKELKIAIQLAAHILEKYYPSHIIARLAISEDEFWNKKGLTVNDWPGLTRLIYTEIFSSAFLKPLQENDTHFKLIADPKLDLTHYTEMVQNATDVIDSEDLDLFGTVQVHLPVLKVNAFNPRSKTIVTLRSPNERDISNGIITPRVRDVVWPSEKLLIPLPVPHPVQIAIIVYNRDAEHPIPLDSESEISHLIKVVVHESEQ